MDDEHITSNSGLNILKRCPELYHRKYFGGGYKTPTTHAMAFGTAFEAHVTKSAAEMSLHSFEDEDGSRYKRRSRAKGVWKYNAADADLLESMMAGLELAPEVKAMLALEGGEDQAPFTTAWRGGQKIRGKLDRWLPKQGVILEIKTAAGRNGSFSVRDFASKAWDLGYFRQAYVYTTAMQRLTGYMQPIDFVWIVCPKVEPFVPCLIRPSADAMTAAEVDLNRLMLSLAKRIETDDWSSGYRNQELILDVPHWAE